MMWINEMSQAGLVDVKLKLRPSHNDVYLYNVKIHIHYTLSPSHNGLYTYTNTFLIIHQS